jgi:outer membrane protein TolC
LAVQGRKRSLSESLLSAAVVVALVAASSPAGARVYTIGECVETALANSVTLAKAGEGLASAGASLMSSWSSLLPKVSASLTASDHLTVSDGAESSTDGKSGSIGLSQTVFDGSAVASLMGSYDSRDVVRLSYEATRREVIFGAKKGYYDLLKAERLRDVQAEALDLAREQLRKTESLFNLGAASKSDLLKAQVQVGQAELALITAEKIAATARATLCFELGIAVLTDLEVEDPADGAGETEIVEYDVEQSISQRPDIRASVEALRAARRSLLAAHARRLPDLSLSVSYGRSEGNLGALFEDASDNHTRSTSLSMSLPIFAGLSTKAAIDAARSNVRTSELSLREARLSAALEIETARLTSVEQKRRVGVAEQAVAQAEEDLKVSEERFKLRAASMLELIDARVAYSKARADLVQARYDYEVAKAELTLALGR